ncbi:hypothetical protein B0H13DRAFT_2395336 [Mycena leptocephala]|nr:hypothetical protein B0H13DRAFT_2395336 [Mycena leptocephala]
MNPTISSLYSGLFIFAQYFQSGHSLRNALSGSLLTASTLTAMERWSRLRAFPALTHLCFTANISGIILPQLLEECSGLRAVVTTWLTRAECRARVNAFPMCLLVPIRAQSSPMCHTLRGLERGEIEASNYDLDAAVPQFLGRDVSR